MLPRLVSQVDPLAELADERAGELGGDLPRCWAAPWP